MMFDRNREKYFVDKKNLSIYYTDTGECYEQAFCQML